MSVPTYASNTDLSQVVTQAAVMSINMMSHKFKENRNMYITVLAAELFVDGAGSCF